jgi:hypothetical protein
MRTRPGAHATSKPTKNPCRKAIACPDTPQSIDSFWINSRDVWSSSHRNQRSKNAPAAPLHRSVPTLSASAQALRGQILWARCNPERNGVSVWTATQNDRLDVDASLRARSPRAPGASGKSRVAEAMRHPLSCGPGEISWWQREPLCAVKSGRP